MEAPDAPLPDQSPHIYSLTWDDKPVIDGLIVLVRRLLRRPTITPHQIALLGKFLYALERLPMITDGIGLDLSLGISHSEGGCEYDSVSIDGEALRFKQGGSTYDASVGSDSFSSTASAIGIGARNGSEDDAAAWLESFAARVKDEHNTIDIEDFGDDEVDWDLDDGRDPWACLPDE